jgi:hypothetical protein
MHWQWAVSYERSWVGLHTIERIGSPAHHLGHTLPMLPCVVVYEGP